jgi:hypothetical protein
MKVTPGSKCSTLEMRGPPEAIRATAWHFVHIYSGIFLYACAFGMVRTTVSFGGTRGCVGDEDVFCKTAASTAPTVVYGEEQGVWLRCVGHLCHRFVQQQHHIVLCHQVSVTTCDVPTVTRNMSSKTPIRTSNAPVCCREYACDWLVQDVF